MIFGNWTFFINGFMVAACFFQSYEYHNTFLFLSGITFFIFTEIEIRNLKRTNKNEKS